MQQLISLFVKEIHKFQEYQLINHPEQVTTYFTS